MFLESNWRGDNWRNGRLKVRWESSRLHGGIEIIFLSAEAKGWMIGAKPYLSSARITYQLSVTVFVKRLTASSICYNRKSLVLTVSTVTPEQDMWAPVVDPVDQQGSQPPIIGALTHLPYFFLRNLSCGTSALR